MADPHQEHPRTPVQQPVLADLAAYLIRSADQAKVIRAKARMDNSKAVNRVLTKTP